MLNYAQIVYVCKSTYPHRKKDKKLCLFSHTFLFYIISNNIKYIFTVFRTY